jgi:serine/threonine-protein kinase ULK/ATG1
MSNFRQDIYDTSQQQQPQRVKVVAGYALQQRLGSGSFATVYKGVKIPELIESDSQQQQQQQQYNEHHERQPTTTNDDSGTSLMSEQPDVVAIKAIARTSEKLTKKVLQNLEIEISILRTYRHPNIVCMHNVQKTDRHFYLILEYCGGGDVQRLIRTRKSGRLTERLTRRLMRDLSAGLKFLWGQELIHRDIKPQNLLLTGCLPLDEVNDPDATLEEEGRRKQINYPTEMFSLKIADFGFARHLQTASLAETLCGSPLYMAPEILQHHR